MLRSTPGGFRLRSRRTLDDRLKAGWWVLRERLRRPRVRRGAIAALAVLVLAGGAAAYLVLRPVPTPDYLIDDLDDVLGYTFLTDEFNRLSLAERLALVKDLVTRLKNMGSSDSALMAAFAAGITGEAREQLRGNLERLGVDIWDDFAKRYTQVKPEDRETWLDSAYVDFAKMMEDLAGEPRQMNDADRLAEGRENAKKGQEWARQNDKGMNGQFGGLVYMAVSRGTMAATPAQQSRMAQFSLDMTRRLRGQDVATGKPK